ncbi:unnamed protein product [Caenorhabditis auriculariae]|uniref:Uncharacterized protein n=1 Tax=Caenorhabditis auriculariae TaxID=2777116 RepID=A0A8S1HSE4_9PELO|nr:unnamed protein product [Caenorhabditis auriculariae]
MVHFKPRSILKGLILIALAVVFYNREALVAKKRRNIFVRVGKEPEKQAHLFENQCKFAWLQPQEPGYYKHVKKVIDSPECPKKYDDVIIRDGVSGEFRFGNGSTGNETCQVQVIKGALRPRARSFKLENEETLVPTESPFWINADNFLITCNEGKKEVFRRQYMGLKDERTPMLIVPGTQPAASADNGFLHGVMSVSILVLDSVSRSQFARHMPLSTKIMEDLGFVTMNAYNKVGDNSAVNLIPILAGPLKEARKQPLFDSSGDVNVARIMPFDASIDPSDVDWIWKQMSGCATMLNDDIMNIGRGLFHYPPRYFKQGFREPPVDHYYRPYYVNLYKEMNNHWKMCHDGRFLSEEFLDAWFRFEKRFSNACHFGFTFIASATHDNPNDLQLLDEQLSDRLTRLKELGAFERTAFIIMGDHGQRVSKLSRHSMAGKIEERAPFLSIMMPESFRRKQPTEFFNLQQNSQRFISNFDLHETLQSIISRDYTSTPFQTRGRSLFLRHDPDRDCIRNNVVSNFCLCMVDAYEDLKAKPKKEQLTMTLQEYVREEKLCLIPGTVVCSDVITSWMPNPQVQVSSRAKLSVEELKKLNRKPIEYVYIETQCRMTSQKDDDVLLDVRFRWQQPKSEPVIVYPPMITSHGNCSHFSFIQDYCNCLGF